jgi:hypothetical protein
LFFIERTYCFISLFFITFAGLPPTTVQGSTFLYTDAVAPTTDASPISTPMPMKAREPTHAPLFKMMDAVIKPASAVLA